MRPTVGEMATATRCVKLKTNVDFSGSVAAGDHPEDPHGFPC